MNLRVLRAGIDTLEVSLAGTITEEVIERLDTLADRAREREVPEPLDCVFTTMLVQPRAFGRWSWRLVDPRFHIVLKRRAAHGGVIGQVRFFSFGLANEHPDMLWMLIRSILHQFGDFTTLAVSRADVCVDFQGWVPQEDEMKNIVCPSGARKTVGTDKGVQTFYFGNKPKVRLYDKTEELDASQKSWFRDVWGQSEDYDPAEPVWRAEFEAYNETLRPLGITSPEVLFEKPEALLDYGLRWAQLRVPTGDQTKTRWPEDPRWTALRAAIFGGVPLQRRMRVPELISLDSVIRRHIGLMATAAAYYGAHDYMDATQRVSMAAEIRMMREDMDFGALVEIKERRILSNDT